MKRALAILGVLTTALVVALAVRVASLRAAGRGPPGGSGVVEGLDVNVVSRLPARVAAVLVREGDVVQRGQVVAELDCRTPAAALEQARAEVASASAQFSAQDAGVASATSSASAAAAGATATRAQLGVLVAQERLARLDLDRARRLVETGALARAELDDAVARDDALVAQIAAQRASEGASVAQASAATSNRTMALAEAAAADSRIAAAREAVARAEEDVRECTLLAPRGGMVATRVREPGEAVQPGSVVLTITDLSDARTRFYVPNAELAAAVPGRMVRVAADAYPGEAFEGTIYWVSPRAEFTPRNVQTREDRERLVYAVEVRVSNPEMKLRAGMPVEVTIEAPTSRDARPAVGMR